MIQILTFFLGLTTAFGAILRAVYYVDCRVRTEGLDLELWLERRAPGGPTW